jgi:hypothetical protein
LSQPRQFLWITFIPAVLNACVITQAFFMHTAEHRGQWPRPSSVVKTKDALHPKVAGLVKSETHLMLRIMPEKRGCSRPQVDSAII